MGGPGVTTKVGRNDPCPCGSGRKYKNCCQQKESAAASISPKAPPAPPSAELARLARALLMQAMKDWDAGRRAEAIAALRQAAQLDPATPDTHYNLGYAYFRSGRLSEAVGCLQRALELRPSFDKALGPLAAALEQLGQECEASDAYRRMSRAAATPAERHLFLGKALLMEDRQEEAEKELRRAVALAPDNALAQAYLGRLLLEQGLFDEARRRLGIAAEAYPGVFQALSETTPMTESDRPLIERMREVAERGDLDPMARGSVHFGLGKAFDDLGEYAEAMRCFEAANRLSAASARIDRPSLAAYYDGIIANFSAEALERAQTPAERPRPTDDLPLLIVGMPRSGTTLVEQILSSHPKVAAGGELTFWADRVKEWWIPSGETGRGSGERRRVGFGAVEDGALAEDYLAELRRIGPEAMRVTDKAPHNFERLGLIRLCLPAARIIHCRRSPVDTCLSTFFTNLKGRHAWDRADLVFQYRQYERLMRHWRAVLPADRFIETDYEALIADRDAETRRLIAFCGLDWSDACLTPERNPRAIKSASLWQARQPVYRTSLERWRRYEPWLGELRELATEAARP
jgi:tetratricopeptide (TPR) repeat protein